MSGEELRALLAEGKGLCSYADTDWGGVVSLLDELDALRAQVERVRAHHKRRPHSAYGGMSDAPPFFDFVAHGQTDFPDQCDSCRHPWPCVTATALDGPQ